MNTKDLDSLISFKMGLPSLYHIMLGMSEDETDGYQKELDERQTDNYDLNDLLKNYDIAVEREAFSDEWRLNEIAVYIPIEHLSEKNIKQICDNLTYKMQAKEKHFSITTDGDDVIMDLNASIHSDLYDVTITTTIREGTEQENVVVTFISEDDVNLDKLRCLAVIANNEKRFAKDITEYIDGHNDYWYE